MVVVNIIYMVAMIPDIRRMKDRKRRGVSAGFDATMEFMPMGRGIKKLSAWLGLSQDKQQRTCSRWRLSIRYAAIGVQWMQKPCRFGPRMPDYNALRKWPGSLFPAHF